MILTHIAKASLLPLVLSATIVALVLFDVQNYLRFETLAENREWLTARVSEGPLTAALAFIGIYAVAVTFSIPGATILTLSGGFLFGTVLGASYSVLGATAGATLLFLIARSSFGESLRFRTGEQLGKLREGFGRNALNYLLFVRLVPLFPFWLINLGAAFLGVPTRTFVVGTVFGIMPGALVYAGVGNGLGTIFDRGEVPDLGIIFDPTILIPILALAGLSLLPIFFRRRQAFKKGGS
jgi:uncharacterized membrane protein YdjX (TVP38/TMEM64 family)